MKLAIYTKDDKGAQVMHSLKNCVSLEIFGDICPGEFELHVHKDLGCNPPVVELNLTAPVKIDLLEE